ncbi:ROK family protein [Abyssalbus ytuae]|uniref:ROK family protein n=1 Tax=Abyssalbus ytuae TaxID=2926907 RepID=A0A9E7D3K1_9FLAO|nr:ROK family protein [Abyssalbus ytuae]UOB17934.1 ROK family protein [Abyssalbus ytuae]
MKKNNIVAGIDIGGTNTKVGLVTNSGNILCHALFKTGARDLYQQFLEKLEHQVKKLLATKQEEYELKAIGIGAPNANFNTGCMEYPVNFNWGEIIPLVDDVNKLFEVPVYLTNDANAAAIGELHFGAGKGMKNFVVLTLGTGLGSGIIVEGKLLVGEHGVAGEIGHISVDRNGRMCNCGLQGCLETYASVTGIRRTVFELIAAMREDSELRNISFNQMDGLAIADAALKGDVIAKKAFEFTGEVLGLKIANVVAVLDPEAIILTGGLTKAGNILLEPVRKSMERNLFKAYRGKIKVITSTLTGSDAVTGAAALAWSEI